jgi:pilus assembly protein CpaB
VQFDQVIEALDRVDIIVSTDNKGERNTSVFMKDVVVRFSQGSGEKFAGVAVEVTAEQAPKLIHMQNYADHIRILKANVGQNSVPSEETEDQAALVEEPAETKVEEEPVVTTPE